MAKIDLHVNSDAVESPITHTASSNPGETITVEKIDMPIRHRWSAELDEMALPPNRERDPFHHDRSFIEDRQPTEPKHRAAVTIPIHLTVHMSPDGTLLMEAVIQSGEDGPFRSTAGQVPPFALDAMADSDGGLAAWITERAAQALSQAVGDWVRGKALDGLTPRPRIEQDAE